MKGTSRNKLGLAILGGLSLLVLGAGFLLLKGLTGPAEVVSEAGMVAPPEAVPGEAQNPLHEEMLNEAYQQEYEAAHQSGESYITPMAPSDPAPDFLEEALAVMDEPPPDLTTQVGAQGPPRTLRRMDPDSWYQLRYERALQVLDQMSQPPLSTAAYFQPPDPPEAEQVPGGDADGGAPAPGLGAPPLAKAGDVFYAVLDTQVSTDYPGPIRASIKDGPLAGAVALGSLHRTGAYLSLSFNTLSHPAYRTPLAVDGVAVDYGYSVHMRTRVKRHYLQRFGALMASAFLQGAGTYSELLTQEGTYVETPLTGQVRIEREHSERDRLLASAGAGLERTAQSLDAELAGAIGRPITVELDAGTHFGLLLLSNLTLGGPAQGAGQNEAASGLGQISGAPAP